MAKSHWKNSINRQYDFVILDVMMPEMDGFAVAQEIRRIGQTNSVCFS
jgi:CheY-like chemotaxis protein